MAKVITSFESADGKTFDTALAADAHDLMQSQKVGVDAYTVAAGLNASEATRARKYIAGYTTFMTTFVPPEAAANDGAAQAA